MRRAVWRAVWETEVLILAVRQLYPGKTLPDWLDSAYSTNPATYAESTCTAYALQCPAADVTSFYTGKATRGPLCHSALSGSVRLRYST